MSFITLRQVGVFTPEPLFQNLSLTIGEGYRIGLVAGNGVGKTTLLRCIAGHAEPTEGEITCSRGLRLGFVEQDVPSALLDQTLFECLRSALPVDQEADTWRVDVLLASFEVPEELHHRTVRALSGGWQKLALIARAFAAEPDALLLDEPTNHLDLAKIQFLERWLNENAGRMPMIIVSHDRRFLDACTTHTLFLRPKASKIYAHAYSIANAIKQAEELAKRQIEAIQKPIAEAAQKETDANQKVIDDLKQKLLGISNERQAFIDQAVSRLSTKATDADKGTTRNLAGQLFDEKAFKDAQKVIDDLNKEMAKLGVTAKQAFVQDALSKLPITATQEQTERTRQLSAALFDQKEAQEIRAQSITPRPISVMARSSHFRRRSTAFSRRRKFLRTRQRWLNSRVSYRFGKAVTPAPPTTALWRP